MDPLFQIKYFSINNGTETGDLNYKNVGIATTFIIVNCIVSFWFRLGLELDYIISAGRCLVQLAVLGLLLQPVFDHDLDPLFVFGLCALLIFLSAIEIVFNKARITYKYMFITVLVSIAIPTTLIAFMGTQFALDARPFYAARRFVPMLGMLLGNTMSAQSVALTHCMQQLTVHKEIIEMRLAYGASRWEAAHSVSIEATRLALLPSLTSMSVTGLVAIPGMMTGQILSGAPIFQAVHYQQIITFMISASAALSSVIVTMICLGICIDGSHRLRLDRITINKSAMRKTAMDTIKCLWNRLRGKKTDEGRNGERTPLLRERRGSPDRNTNAERNADGTTIIHNNQ